MEIEDAPRMIARIHPGDRANAELASDSLDNQPIGSYTDAVDELLSESLIEMERRTR